MTVHNHGPHEGRGLDCPERLIGACMTTTPQSHWFTQSAVDEYTAGLRATLEARTEALTRTIERAEKAEAERDEIRAKVEALADEWESWWEMDPDWDELTFTGTEAPKGWTENAVQDAIEASGIWLPWLRKRLAAVLEGGR